MDYLNPEQFITKEIIKLVDSENEVILAMHNSYNIKIEQQVVDGVSEDAKIYINEELVEMYDDTERETALTIALSVVQEIIQKGVVAGATEIKIPPNM